MSGQAVCWQEEDFCREAVVSKPLEEFKNRAYVLPHPSSGQEDDLCYVVFIPSHANALGSAVVSPAPFQAQDTLNKLKLLR